VTPAGRLTPDVGERAHEHVSGPDDAPVTLVEYGDFECPYCGMAYPIVKSIQRQLGDGLRFVFRHFPLSEAHPHAEHAAEAVEAAAVEGRFWEMHDIVYEHQDALDDASLVAYAATVGAEPGRVAAALTSGTFAARVREDFRSGVRSGVNGTPSFFINGTRFDGAWNDEASFLEALRAAAEFAR
jgi:protein-disulfide isomerase